MVVFYATHGHGPWNCYFCSSTVTVIGKNTWDGNVHHIDDDKSNDVPDNVTMVHTICHQQYHAPTEEQRVAISRKLKGRQSPTLGMKFPDRKPLPWQGPGNGHLAPRASANCTPRANANRASRSLHSPYYQQRQVSDYRGELNPFFGKKHTDEALQKMRTPRDRLRCENCGEIWSKNWITRHKQEGKCVQRHSIEINGTVRVRGKLPKTLCSDCGKPYAKRWMQRHKNEGKCLRESGGQCD